jgi:flavin reductase (DIM6/NTAB) family NADH-FMN oxidoreductase RutF
VRPDRHSHDLIAETKEFVINIPTVDLIEETDFCGPKSERDVDKFADTGLTAVPSSHVNPPLIAECPINIECKVIHSTRQGTHTVFFGEAVNVHVREDLFPEQFLDFKKLPVILSSSTDYLVVGDPIRSRGR